MVVLQQAGLGTPGVFVYLVILTTIISAVVLRIRSRLEGSHRTRTLGSPLAA